MRKSEQADAGDQHLAGNPAVVMIDRDDTFVLIGIKISWRYLREQLGFMEMMVRAVRYIAG